MKKIFLLLLLILTSISGYSQQGFESTTGPDAIPSTNWTLSAGVSLNGNWAVFDNGVGTGVRWDINNTLPYAGVNAAYCNRENIGAGGISEDYLATPTVLIPANAQLKFWTRQFASFDFGTVFEIRIKPVVLNTVAEQTDPTGYVTIQNWDETTITTTFDVYEEKIVNIPATYVGQNVYVAFVMTVTQPAGVTYGDRWLVDDVKVVAQCFVPSAGTATGMTATTANLSWTGPAGGGASSYDIYNGPSPLAVPNAGTTPTGTSTTTTYTQGGLTGLTNYCYYVRSVCGPGNTSPWAGPFCYVTPPGPAICGGNFVDFGGLGNYPNNENRPYTISPVTAGDVVTVTFTSFNVAAGDFLTVYSGTSTTAPSVQIGGPLTGTTIPGPFTSFAPGGELHFVFTSNATGVAAGWTANITCDPRPPCSKPVNLAIPIATITATSAIINWTDTAGATSWKVWALPCGSAAPTATTPGFQTATATSHTFTGLIQNTCYDFYVMADCGTSTSPPAGPITINTLISCSRPTTLAVPVATIQDVQVTVTWTQPLNPDGSAVTTWEYLALPCPQIALPGIGTPATGIATASPFVVNGLIPNTCYNFYVRAVCGADVSSWSNLATATTLPSCAMPTTLTIGTITQTTALAGWTQPANPNGSFATTWEIMVLPQPSIAPLPTSTGWTTVSANPYFFTGLTHSTCYDYYVRATCGTSGNSFIAGPKAFCTLIPNDDCSGSILAPVNQNTNCLQTVTGSLNLATASTQANSCDTTADDDDVWFHFTATSTQHYVSLFGINYTATPTNLRYAIYSGTCPTLTQVGGCVTNAQQSNPIVTGLTAGTTYFIRVYSTGTVASSTTFELCIGTNVGNCGNALPLCAITPIIIPNNVGVATLPNPVSPYSTTATGVGCLGSAPSPTFYYLQIPQNGAYNFFLEQNTSNTFAAPGIGIDVDFVAWGPYASNAAACAGITTANAPATGGSCSFSAAFTENYNIPAALAGEVYVIMITNFNGRKGFVRITQTAGPIPTVCCPFGNFTYSSTAYCQNGVNPSPTFVSNAVAGTFTATPAGLSINPTTGTINLATSAPGTYTIHNVIAANGACPTDDDTWTLTITAPPSATTIAYSSASYCRSDSTTYSVTQTGTTGGNYTVNPTGLGINITTGAITPSSSTASGTYEVKYNLPAVGGCQSAQATATVTIIDTPTSGTVSGTQNVCLPGTSQFTTTGTPGGTWSSSDTAIATISATGLVTGVSAGTATISYLAAGTGVAGCTNPVPATRTITFWAPVVSGTISGNTVMCLPLPQSTQLTTTGTTGGVWSSVTPAVATVNATTGLVTAVAAGTSIIRYTITNPVGSPCTNPVAAQVTVTVAAAITAGTLSGTQPICVGGTTTFVSTVLGGTWDVFPASAVASVNATSGIVTGLAAGTATIRYTYTGTGVGGCTGIATATRTVTVTAPPNVGVISAPNYTLCIPGTTQFTTNGATGGSWISSNPAVATVNIGTGLVTAVSAGTTDIRYRIIAAAPCGTTFSAPVPVTVVAPVTAGTLSGTPTTICIGDTTTYSSTVSGGTWDVFPASAVASVNASTGVVTGLSAGTATIRYTVTGTAPCANATATRNVTVNAINTLTLTSAVGTDMQTITLGSPITTITYTTTGATSVTVSNLPPSVTYTWIGNVLTISGTPTGIGNYPYTINMTGGCPGTGTYSPYININPSTNIVLTSASGTNNQTICNNSAITNITYATSGGVTGATIIGLPTNLTGVWNADVFTISGTVNATAGVYNYTITTVGGIGPATASGTVTVTASRTSDFAPIPAFCSGTTVPTLALTSPNGVAGTWLPATISNTASGSYVFTPTSSCDTGQTLNVTVTPSRTSNFAPIPAFCAGTTAPTLALTSPNGVTGTWSPATISNTASGSYVFTPTSSCDTGQTLNISIIPQLAITVTGTCQGAPFVMNVAQTNGLPFPAGTTFAWSNGSGFSSTLQSPIATQTGNYTVIVTENGCQTPGYLQVDSISCQIQNGISPNNDTRNDSFELTAYNVAKLSIYNRYGAKQYSKDNYTNEWFGQSDSGAELPDGTYYYTIERKNGESLSGWIYINRENK